jgi:para-aminobenzoate synthetase/4-amino-4-deoxychorismate lyase
MTEPFVLFDDARDGAPPATLFADARGEVAAWVPDEVKPALDRMRALLADGRHLAGFVSYEAGYALEPKLLPLARRRKGLPLLWFGIFDAPVETEVSDDAAAAWIGKPRPRISRDAYLAAGAEVREHLFAGDYYQANLTFGCDVAVKGSPMAAYAGLRKRAKAGWGGVVRWPGGWLLSASPEQFFALKSGKLEARPMKGTARRFADAGEDRKSIEALVADPKQRAENLMIVDLLRNDLARVAETGSVAVPELFAVESYPTVHQMVSRVTADLRDGLDAIDVLATLFPCGSITGAPKIAAMESLRALEPEPRGAYTGAMGWLSPQGDAAFNVLIRTLELHEGEDEARLGLGSGVVVDSVMENEWDECLLKGSFVTRSTEDFDLIETMRFDPTAGIANLERHLDRLKDSATTFGFRFDRHDARNELQAATFRHTRPAMLRLLLSPKGSIAIELRPVPEPPVEPVIVSVAPMPVEASDIRVRYKTTARRFYDEARRDGGEYETIFVDSDGCLTEGSFTNIFVERDGKLLTPPTTRGLIPGVLRAELIDEVRAAEADLTIEDLADGFLIGNSLRGMIRAKLA